ncbi:complement C1q tumor necrosis factor-related protein 3-like [Heptranchias perlo]|uniref:complement C1q tumor necrosis factor-related protein 3-like n=1 Tax=Heptranchias perlo TaxID=212740 RepID=UPI0035597A07
MQKDRDWRASRGSTTASSERRVGEKAGVIPKTREMGSFGMRNLLCLILLHCICQTSTLENVLEDLLGAVDEEMGQRNPLRLIMEAEARLGAAFVGCKDSDVVFDVQRSTMKHVLTPENPIIYDVINVNCGNGYSDKSGKFTSPLCGLYFFSYSSLPGRGLQTDVALMKNGTEVAVLHSVLASNSSQLSTKNMILELHKGEQVWVKLAYGNLWSRAGSVSFQGFRLTR